MAATLDCAAIFLTGTVGSGKTSTASAIGDLLAEVGVAHAVIDLDWLRNFWPSDKSDPFNTELELANLAAVSKNFVALGARRLVLAGVIEDPMMRTRYEDAVGMPLVVCRLKIDLLVVGDRLARRHLPGADLDWHANRAEPLDLILDAAQIEDYLVEVHQEPPAEVAEAVLRAVGWTE